MSATRNDPFQLRLLVRRVGAVAASSVIAQAISGAVYVISARALGPAEFGRYVIGIAIATFAVVLFDGGLMSFIVRDVAAGRLTYSHARYVVRRKRIFVPAVLPVVGGACFFVLVDWRGAVLLALVWWFSWETLVGNSLLRAKERFADAQTAQLLGRTAGVLIAGLSFLELFGVYVLAVSLVVSWLIEAVVTAWKCRTILAAATQPRVRLRDCQRDSISYGLTSMSSVGQQLDAPIVAAGAGVVEAGLYGAAGRLIGPLNFLSSALNSVSTPWLARAHDKPILLLRQERRVLKIGALLAAVPVAAALVGQPLIVLLLGKEYSTSGTVFIILAAGASVSTLRETVAVLVQNRRSPAWVAASSAIGLTIGLPLTYVMSSNEGATGAAYGYGISQSVILVILATRFYVLRKRATSTSTAALRRSSIGGAI